MNQKAKALTLAAVILITALAGVLFINMTLGQKSADKLYTLPVQAGEKTFTITVLTNETSKPIIEMSSPTDTLKFFAVAFVGHPGHTPCFFNITYPTSLIWGNFSLVFKYYVQSPDKYTLSNNGTHQSVYMAYIHYDTTAYFEIRGTEAVW